LQNIATKSVREHPSGTGDFAWLATARQTIPRFFRLTGCLRPTLHIPDLRRLEPAILTDRGIRAVLWDVDGTLMEHHGDRVDPELLPAFDRLLAQDGVQHAILSNCGEKRFVELGKIFPHLPVLRAYSLTGRVVRRTLLQGQDRWSDPAAQAFHPHQVQRLSKPSDLLFRCAMEELGIADPRTLMMIGDQYFTDVAGANLCGAASVKVSTWRRDSFPLALRLFQRAEQLIFLVRYGREASA
jgi:HAD superfamily phosphatase (TIGR01668 family)